MARYRLLARIAPIGADEWQVTVSAVAQDLGSAEVRAATVGSVAQAELRRDYLVMSLATELRARGHEVLGIDE